MQNTVYGLMYLASAPLALMPATFALVTKSPRVVPIACLNVLLWGGTCLLLRFVPFGGGQPERSEGNPEKRRRRDAGHRVARRSC
jgi:hypothetical protein